MAGTQCPKCNGTGRVASQNFGYDVHKVGAGMGMHRCDRCGGQGVIHNALGVGGTGGTTGESLGTRVANFVIFIFAAFFALAFGNAPPFGLNWAMGAIVGGFFGAILGGVLLAFKIGRYILWALGIGFVVAVIIALNTGS